jgi:hypothetical protein
MLKNEATYFDTFEVFMIIAIFGTVRRLQQTNFKEPYEQTFLQITIRKSNNYN